LTSHFLLKLIPVRPHSHNCRYRKHTPYPKLDGKSENSITLFAGGILSLFGDVTISWPVCKDPTGVDCWHRTENSGISKQVGIKLSEKTCDVKEKTRDKQ
jgi:hypothetical protein